MIAKKKTKQLEPYKKKRDFTKTPEPKPKVKKSKTGHIFVVQKHNASHLHYDFRLEINGVLVSWAIPKGPSLDPSVKRLAIQTEDHPFDYAHFEGVIPEGYGAGTVMVWDTGTYENIKMHNGKLVPIEESLKNGQIEVFLNGKKLKGGFVLIRTNFGGKQTWLFKKIDDEYADARRNPVKTQDKSVLTNRTTAQIAKEDSKKESLMSKLVHKFSHEIENIKEKGLHKR